jgi:hypothetical protein
MRGYYCNTWHEETLVSPKVTLRALHYLFQYLPTLYAPKGSVIYVDAFALSENKDFTILAYEGQADVDLWVHQDPLTEKLLSKEFIFHHSKRPKGSKIIYSIEEALAFEAQFNHNVVFKQFLSFSAMGHARCANDILSFPCLGEPWMKRTLDFSSQWIVHDNGPEYLGLTHLLVSSQGGYRGTEIGTVEIEPKLLSIHTNEALEVLERIHSMGFRGNVGFDAFIHESGFQPICEMNPRKTMGYVALMYARRENLKKLRLRIGPKPASPLLPTTLLDRYNIQLQFPKNLFLDKL